MTNPRLPVLVRVEARTRNGHQHNKRPGFTGGSSGAFWVEVVYWVQPDDGEALAALPGALETILAAAAQDWVDFTQPARWVGEATSSGVQVEERAS